jgi:hypothetical protein
MFGNQEEDNGGMTTPENDEDEGEETPKTTRESTGTAFSCMLHYTSFSLFSLTHKKNKKTYTHQSTRPVDTPRASTIPPRVGTLWKRMEKNCMSNQDPCGCSDPYTCTKIFPKVD